MRAVMIDGSNTYAAAKTIGLEIDWVRFRQRYIDEGFCLRLYYFTALPPAEIESPQRKLADWLSYNGYDLVTKETKSFINDDGSTKVKGNMDIELAIAACRIAHKITHIDLWTGDGDFVPLVKFLQDHGIVVTVYSTIKSNPSMCADNLRRAADYYHDIADMHDTLVRSRAIRHLSLRGNR